MECKEVKELLLGYLDNEVNPEGRGAIEAHLSTCLSCREEMEALASVQRELRQAFKEITARAPPPHAWVSIKEHLEREEHRRIPILDLVKLKMGDGLERLRSRPAWQKALARVLTVALIIGLCLTIPLLLSQSPEALAKSIAMEDPGVQVLLAERGFSQPSMVNAVTVKSDKANIYYVYLMSPKDEALIGTVAVDIKEGMVTKIGLTKDTEEYVQPPGPTGVISMEDIIAIARGDPTVQDILDAGAEVGAVSYFFSTHQGEMVALELRLGEKSWLVKIDWTEGEVTSVLER